MKSHVVNHFWQDLWYCKVYSFLHSLFFVSTLFGYRFGNFSLEVPVVFTTIKKRRKRLEIWGDLYVLWMLADVKIRGEEAIFLSEAYNFVKSSGISRKREDFDASISEEGEKEFLWCLWGKRESLVSINNWCFSLRFFLISSFFPTKK